MLHYIYTIKCIIIIINFYHEASKLIEKHPPARNSRNPMFLNLQYSPPGSVGETLINFDPDIGKYFAARLSKFRFLRGALNYEK